MCLNEILGASIGSVGASWRSVGASSGSVGASSRSVDASSGSKGASSGSVFSSGCEWDRRACHASAEASIWALGASSAS